MVKEQKKRFFIMVAFLCMAIMAFLLFFVLAGHSTLFDSSDFFETIPPFEDAPFVYLNDNEPVFNENEIWDRPQEYLSLLDDMGRCGIAMSCIGKEGMPTGKRGQISSIHPTGWHDDMYSFVDGGNLYNRCHLIGYQLSGNDAIDRNLITGTRYMNVNGMLPFENAIASYVIATGNHVMYRVTPIFIDKELLARGVHLEAMSVEDRGDSLSFNVFCYNVQPGVDIDYMTGDNKAQSDSNEASLQGYYTYNAPVITNGSISRNTASIESQSGVENNNDPGVMTYVLNVNTMRFHYEYCPSVNQMNPKNKVIEVTTRDELIESGYTPCGSCRP